jgi:hypothetical protein
MYRWTFKSGRHWRKGLDGDKGGRVPPVVIGPGSARKSQLAPSNDRSSALNRDEILAH